MQARLSLPEVKIWDFLDEFLVHCPRCKKQAFVRDRGELHEPRFVLTCGSCGHNSGKAEIPCSILYHSSLPATKKPNQMIIGAPVDPYFHQPLWLQIECCGKTLWSYNRRHLEWIEDYVAATLRERRPYPVLARNNTLGSRLPSWMKKASHRDPILKAISILKHRL